MNAVNTLPVFSSPYYVTTAYVTFGLLLPGSLYGVSHFHGKQVTSPWKM